MVIGKRQFLRTLRQVNHDAEKPADLLKRRHARVFPGMGINGHAKFRPASQRCFANLFLRIKIMKEAALGQAGLGTNLVHRRGGKAPVEHQAHGRVDQLLPGFRRLAFWSLGISHTNWLVCNESGETGQR
jgi:hypothetical protein